MNTIQKITSAVLLTVTTLATQTVLAYYNPSTGRFLSRDPIGEPGFQVLQMTQWPSQGGLAPIAQQSSRWISRDPSGEKRDKHLYTLAGNNPIVNIDVLGLIKVGTRIPVKCFDGTKTSPLGEMSVDQYQTDLTPAHGGVKIRVSFKNNGHSCACCPGGELNWKSKVFMDNNPERQSTPPYYDCAPGNCPYYYSDNEINMIMTSGGLYFYDNPWDRSDLLTDENGNARPITVRFETCLACRSGIAEFGCFIWGYTYRRGDNGEPTVDLFDYNRPIE